MAPGSTSSESYRAGGGLAGDWTLYLHARLLELPVSSGKSCFTMAVFSFPQILTFHLIIIHQKLYYTHKLSTFFPNSQLSSNLPFFSEIKHTPYDLSYWIRLPFVSFDKHMRRIIRVKSPAHLLSVEVKRWYMQLGKNLNRGFHTGLVMNS